MIIRSEEIKSACSNLRYAVDSNNNLSNVTDMLELDVVDKNLEINVTNKEYFVKVKIDIGEEIDFHATVNADVFIKLIPQMTTETIEFTISDNVLIIKGNGEYKIPIIYDDDEIVRLPEIVIDNVTSSFSIPSSVLNDIYTYNSKEINKGLFSHPSQKMFYVDENGCITFTTGACVNAFTLPEETKMLLNQKVVGLFRLISTENMIMSIGTTTVDEVEQTIVSFTNPKLSITSIVNVDDSLLGSVPVTAIRNRAYNAYTHSVSVRRESLLQTINRLLIFTGNNSLVRPYSKFVFSNADVTVYDKDMNNKEVVTYSSNTDTLADGYEAVIDLIDVKMAIESLKDEFVTVKFGDQKAIVVQSSNIYNVIPEVII